MVLAVFSGRIIAPDPPAATDLLVSLEGFENDHGMVLIALCDSRQDYESPDKAFRTIAAQVEQGSCKVVFDSLLAGEYAVKVYHDENGNGQLDKNFMGIPIENYGFSNNARGTFGPPDWDAAKFSLPAQGDSIIIKIY